MKLRLDKYLTEMGCGTRSQVKKEILKGSVSVNGEIAKKAERKVDTEKDEIIFKGEKIFYARGHTVLPLSTEGMNILC